MEYLGFDRYSGSVYEGTPNGGYRVMPPPLLVPIRFFEGKELPAITPWSDGLASAIFREDSFDAVTKIRRGRVFAQQLAAEWRVSDPHSQTLPYVKWADGTAQLVRLQTYQRDVLSNFRSAEGRVVPSVALGNDGHVTFWRIVSVEANLVGTPVLTLRAKHSLGDTPELIDDKVPPEALEPLRTALEGVEGAVNRLGALDVIDRCRAVLAIAFAHRAGEPEKDLGKAINMCVKMKVLGEDDMLAHAGRIVAKLHSRGKAGERAKYGLKPPVESDSNFALECVRSVLIEFGWAQ